MAGSEQVVIVGHSETGIVDEEWGYRKMPPPECGFRMKAQCLLVTPKERGFQRCSTSSGLGGTSACRLRS
jgi:hypothetical protein